MFRVIVELVEWVSNPGNLKSCWECILKQIVLNLQRGFICEILIRLLHFSCCKMYLF